MATSSARIYTSAEAQRTILKRGLIEDTSVPPHVQARIDQMFGEPTTPVQCVQNILRSVREKGDKAVQYWTKTIDGVDVSSGAEISYDTVQASLQQVPAHVVDALRLARDRVVSYHKKQPVTSWFTNDLGGTVGQAIRPIERVGFYVPGGTAPLPSTVLMSVLPAVVAGCEQLIVVSPPDRESATIASVTLAACAVINEMEGVKVRVFTVGGSQAVGALAYGTATIPRVDKIVGPGNIFVAIAKKEVYGVVGIDGIYGPTEAVVVADEHANAELVAADLLAQAEHDFMAVPILLTDSKKLAEEVQKAVDVQIEKLDRKESGRMRASGERVRHRARVSVGGEAVGRGWEDEERRRAVPGRGELRGAGRLRGRAEPRDADRREREVLVAAERGGLCEDRQRGGSGRALGAGDCGGGGDHRAVGRAGRARERGEAAEAVRGGRQLKGGGGGGGGGGRLSPRRGSGA
ncbi:histidinol dehydrogenase [Gracilaria domingensis]|nr:histidinol dehydrogenase [Gracilaria domingensis]